MKKYLLIIVFMLIGNTIVFSQNFEARKRDSLRIDSLIKKIPVTKDTARINYLNKLSGKILLSSYPQKTKADQAAPYVEMAYREAKLTGYQIGIAHSLMHLCQITTNNFRYNRRYNIDNTATLNKNEAYLNELMEIAIKINDAEILGDAYEEESSFWFRKKNNQKIIEANRKAIYWYKKSGNESAESAVNFTIAAIYLETGEFENAFDYCKRALDLAKKLSAKPGPDSINYVWLQLSWTKMSDLYKAAGDFESSMNLLQESRQFHITQKSTYTWGMELELADLFLYTGQYDSTIHYLLGIKNINFSYHWPMLGDAYFKLNKPDSALKYYNLALDSMEKIRLIPNAIDGLKRIYLGKARILNQQKNNKEALKFAKKSLLLNQQRLVKLDVLNAYELISTIFHQLGNNDSAYVYLIKYNELRDSMLTRQFLFQLNNYKSEANEAKKEARMGFLDRDNKIKEAQLTQEASLKKFLIAGLILLLITGIFIFRYVAGKRKNEKLASEKKQAELQQQATDLEMKALRAQMNPHFIFNCLSSINKFILKNDTETASDYLTRFSRLIRQVLTNSQLTLIPLSDEVDMLRLYLDMERLRFSESFSYNIIYENTIEPETIYIPPMLLQPFCENAIWHGLMHKEGQGKLDVMMSIHNNELQCIITDNGIGREKAAELKSKTGGKQKSVGLKITTERLALFNNEKTVHNFYQTEDLVDNNGNSAGTKVILKINFKQSVADYVTH